MAAGVGAYASLWKNQEADGVKPAPEWGNGSSANFRSPHGSTAGALRQSLLGGASATSFAAGVRWSFRGKDAGSARIRPIRARLRTRHRGEQRAPAAQGGVPLVPPQLA